MRAANTASALVGLVVAGLAGASPALGADFTYPAERIGDTRSLWQEIMTHFHGPYDRGRRCWIGSSGGERYCMRPHRLDTVEEDGVTRLFAVTGGAAIDGGSCHACGGSLGLIVLEVRDGALRLAARNGLYDAVGSWGEVPPQDSFAVERIGRDGHGWTMFFGYTGQGITEGGKAVFGRVGDEVAELGFVPTSLDTCGYDPDNCRSYEFDLGFVETEARFFDVELTLSAESDRPEGPTGFRVPFDEVSMSYQVPDALEEVLR